MKNTLSRLLILPLLLLLFSPAAGALAQDQPGQVKYPAALDTQDSLIRVTNSARTTLSGGHDASVTTINVGSTASFPASGAAVVDSEIFFYTGRSSTAFTGVTRGADGSAAATHLSGAAVRGVIAAAHHDVLVQAVRALQAKVGTGSSLPSLGTCQQGTGPGTSAWLACPGGSSGSVSAAQGEYFKFLNALMEPMALEQLQTGAYTYTVGANEYKIALQVWYSALDDAGCTGRFEVRDPHFYLPLRNVTLKGCFNPGTPGSGSHALILNPALATYSDPVGTYYDRAWKLNTQLRSNSVPITGPPVKDTFAGDTAVLVGAYGGVVTQVTNFDTPYFIMVTAGGQWINMHDELGDNAQTQLTTAPYTVSGNGVWRFGGRPNLPVTKYLLSAVRIGPGDPENPGLATSKGSVTWVNFPSDWSKVTDPTVYTFRDDMIGTFSNPLTALDTTKWTASGGASLDTKSNWYKFVGGGTAYGADGIRSIATYTRAADKELELDVSLTDNSRCAVGWTNTTGANVGDWAHAVVLDTLSTSYRASVYEDNNLRHQTSVGTILSKRSQHIKIKLNADGSAVYRIQSQGFTDGGGNLAVPGSSVWHTLPVSGSSSATNSLKLFATCYDGTGYVNDIKVIN